MVVAVGLIILMGEALIMALIEIVPLSILREKDWDFIDPVLLTTIVSPMLYFLIYRPLNQQVLRERQFDELRRFQKVVVGRELRMKKLVEENTMLSMQASPGKADEATGNFMVSQLGIDMAELPGETGGLEAEQRNALLFMLEDLEKARNKIEQAHQQWMVALDVVPDPIFLHNKEFRVLRANRAYAARAGMSFDEFIGKPYYQIFPKLSGPLSTCQRALRTRQVEAEELTLESGGIIRSRSTPVFDAQGEYLHSIHILEDITERRTNETKIQRLTQFYAALSQCNEAIVRCTSEAELFSQICRVAVQYAGMKMAWVGIGGRDGQVVKPAASSGDGTEYLEGIKFRCMPTIQSAAVQSVPRYVRDVSFWIQDFLHDPLTAPWHERGAHFGWSAAASLPLRRNGVVIGSVFAVFRFGQRFR